jgi:hypothetical protein
VLKNACILKQILTLALSTSYKLSAIQSRLSANSDGIILENTLAKTPTFPVRIICYEDHNGI